MGIGWRGKGSSGGMGCGGGPEMEVGVGGEIVDKDGGRGEGMRWDWGSGWE